ncbi:MAG: Bug family tripartite tricarboxylate transporter substrate binding protein [Lautropia sp.]
MRESRIRVRRLLVACLAPVVLATASLLHRDASAQEWPTRPIRWIVPFPPGGPADVTARLIAPKLTARLGQPVVVENRPGASSNIGYEAAVRANPDGYTMLLAVAGLVTNPHVFKLNFDPMKDLVPVAQLNSLQMVLLGSEKFAARNLSEAMAHANANPGTVTCAWGGSVLLQLVCESLRLEGKADIQAVAYKGGAPAMTDLIGGQVDMMIDVINTAVPQIKAGKVKLLAVANRSRGRAPFPDAPTIAESIPGFEMNTWQGVMMPAGTPKEIVSKMNAAIGWALAQPDVAARVAESGLDVAFGTPEQFGALLRNDFEKYGRLIRAAGISTQ